MTNVTILGSVACRSNGSHWKTLAPSARQLLAIMVAAGPGGLSFERVADELWPNELPATWDASLRMALTRLRKRLPAGSLTSKSRWCRLELSADDVDVWHLTALADQPGVTLNADDLVGHVAQEAFPGVEVSPIIRKAIDEFDLLRSLLLDRLIDQGASLSPLLVVRLRSFAASRDWDTDFGNGVEALIEALTDQAGGRTRSSSTVAPSSAELPPSLARHRAQKLVGRETVVEQVTALATNTNGPVAMLAGPPRSGRSATLAEVGAQLAMSGWRIIYLEPTVPAAAFGPFLQALPELREPLLAALASDASEPQIRSRCWLTILQALDQSDLPTCVIVDDVEMLDSNSEEALAFVGRSRTTKPLSVVIAADPAHPAVEASDWVSAPRVLLDPLPLDALREMIANVHPTSADLQRLQLSDQISTLTDGLAGNAFQLARAADPETLTLPPLLSAFNDTTAASIDVPLGVLTVAVAASIIRSPISLEHLEHVTRGEPHRILTAIDELLGVGFLTETTRPDVFELARAHQHSDVAAALPPHEVARFSKRAMSLAERNPVTLAADALRARPLVSDTEAIEALLAAAAPLTESQSHREVVAHIQAAEDLGAALSAETLVAYATSLELTGADAADIRERAIALASDGGQAGLALQAALAGLPRAEQVDGDAVRTKLIESIDPAGLNRTEQLQRHLALSRQLLLLSRRDDAQREAHAATELVETIEDDADVWLALAHIGQWLPSGNPTGGFQVARFEALDQVVDPNRRARLHQASAVSAVVAGDFVTAAQEVSELTAAADSSEDPLRVWHAALLRSVMLNNELKLEEAERVAEEARDLGVSFGLAGAVAGRLAQRSNRAMLLGDDSDTRDRFETATPDAMRSLLARAAAGMQLARAGRSAEAVEVAERVLTASAGSRFETAVAGVLSAAVDRTAPAVRARIAEALEPHRGTLLVVGAGVTVQGPVESLMANVAPTPAAALELRHAAVELADSWASPLWQIVTRIQLADEYLGVGEAAQHRKHRSDAAERAANTQFATYERWGLFES